MFLKILDVTLRPLTLLLQFALNPTSSLASPTHSTSEFALESYYEWRSQMLPMASACVN
ncbi:hypothetical protein [Schlesneria sp. T3-172]|uniref:hypothetical protein n=1 Tax=Schlesneria sphaerica TaxID=3373610 RepID=UPI0037C89E2D